MDKQTEPKILTYLLRDIPRDLWAEAKHAAIDRGMTVRELIFVALRNEIEKKV